MRLIARAGVGSRRRDPTPVFMLLPAVVIFLGVQVFPMLYSGAISLYRWDGLSEPRWVGLGNYAGFLTQDTNLRGLFSKALTNNIMLAAYVTIGVVVVAAPLAVALNSAKGRLRGVFRATLVLPMVTAGIAVYYVWRALLGPAGPVTGIFGLLHLEQLAPSSGWLGDSSLALPGMAIIMIWANVPYATLFYLSGLQGIDGELYDAASVDGANAWAKFRYITVPALRPVTSLVVLLNIVQALQSYEMIYLITNGGPNYATNTVGLLSYNLAFGTLGGGSSQLGMAAAMSWSIILGTVGLLALARLTRSRKGS